MKIGILTFHWAVNYGAILQALSLQEFLIHQGHSVEIIDFKPIQYDFRLMDYFAHPRSMFPKLRNDLRQLRKDHQLDVFRKRYLNLTQRCTSIEEVEERSVKYDVLISGSDQILNPGFTLSGDKGPCSVYYLTFASDNQVKIGYSVSFGCTEYPKDALHYAEKWIGSFDKIGVRESSGFDVLKQMKYSGTYLLTPDPVVLYGRYVVERLSLVDNAAADDDYIYSYMLHGAICPLSNDSLGLQIINETKQKKRTIENWISSIYHAKFVVTNSYHGTIVAMVLHKPFAVVLSSGSLAGMNDRFTTLLSRVGLLDRISDNKEESIKDILYNPIDWSEIDKHLEDFRSVGKIYLKF